MDVPLWLSILLYAVAAIAIAAVFYLLVLYAMRQAMREPLAELRSARRRQEDLLRDISGSATYLADVADVWAESEAERRGGPPAGADAEADGARQAWGPEAADEAADGAVDEDRSNSAELRDSAELSASAELSDSAELTDDSSIDEGEVDEQPATSSSATSSSAISRSS